MKGPLAGLRVVLAGGIGPAPYCAMLLADMGADVVRVERRDDTRQAGPLSTPVDVFSRGQTTMTLDLKRPDDVRATLDLIERSDIVIEGFRPGVMERLGLGPEVCLARNRRLVYGRVTGWGQTGPLAHAPGHDINYIALSGALHSIGRPGQPPTVPLNLLGDFAGGGQQLALGILAALFERSQSGKGQVIDAAMVDGAATLMTIAYGLEAFGKRTGSRGEGLLEGGAHFYCVYECADGEYLAVGAIEAAFYRQLLALCGIDDPTFIDDQFDETRWPHFRKQLAEIFRTRSRDAWCAEPLATAACVSPVLSVQEAPKHPHHLARKSFMTVDGVVLPAPAPCFSRTPMETPVSFASSGSQPNTQKPERKKHE